MLSSCIDFIKPNLSLEEIIDKKIQEHMAEVLNNNTMWLSLVYSERKIMFL